MSNWGVEKKSGGSQSEVVFDDEGGIYYDRDGNIIEGFFDDSLNGVMNGHGWETRGRRDWGEEAVFWFDRAVRTEALLTLPTGLPAQMNVRQSRLLKNFVVGLRLRTRTIRGIGGCRCCWCLLSVVCPCTANISRADFE